MSPKSVFLSHTGELAGWPVQGRSFIGAAKEAVTGAGHRVVDMAYFGAAPRPAADVCAQRVRGCDIYVGVFGHRYGSIVADDPEQRSYTEFEFDTAVAHHIPILLFYLDKGAATPGEWVLDDPAGAVRQKAFRERARVGHVSAKFTTPDDLLAQLLMSLQNLTDAARPSSAPQLVPALTAPVVDRPEITDKLTEILTAEGELTVAVTGVFGSGGFGKTTAVQSVCIRQSVVERYPGGILWVTIGQEPTHLELASKINDLTAHLAGVRPTLADPEQAGLHLGMTLAGRPATLLVIDDVWSAADLQPLMLGGGSSVTRVITTRNRDLLPTGARRVLVGSMTTAEARRVLTRDLPPLAPAVAERLLGLTGQWPLLLALVNGILANEVADGNDVDVCAAALADQLSAEGPAHLSLGDERDRHHAVRATVQASLATLTPGQEARYRELAIFPEDLDIPVAVLEVLWGATGGLRPAETAQLCRTLVSRSLAVRYRPDGGWLRLHDVLRAYLRGDASAADLAAANGHLLDAAATSLGLVRDGTPAWWDLPAENTYLRGHLVDHLAAAGRTAELDALLRDLRWAELRLRHDGPVRLDADLARSTDPAVSVLRRAIRQNAHLLSPMTPPHALAAVLRSRLSGYPELSRLVDAQPADPVVPRIEPHWALPDLPHPALDRTLPGHQKWVKAVAFFPDGTRMVTGSSDHTVRIWDLATGATVRVLLGHTDAVNGVAVAPDGTWLATAGRDRTVRIWDAESGQLRQTLQEHRESVTSVAIAPDGTWLISGSRDTTAILWDAATGRVLRRIWDHPDTVTAVAIEPHGRSFATACRDRTVRLWTVGGPPTPQVFVGHSDKVSAIEYLPDASALVSASSDRTVRIWELTTGLTRQVIDGHTDVITGLAVARDGNHLATTSRDATARIWDPVSGRELHALTGHTDWVNAVAIAPDSTRIATASGDRTARVWDVASVGAPDPGTGHVDWVTGIALSPDSTWAATTSRDRTIRVWNIADGRLRHVLYGHNNWVLDVAIAPNGRWLVTGGADHTAMVWDIGTGRPRRTLAGHTNWVTAVAVAPSGTWIATASQDLSIRLWDTRTGQAFRTFGGHDDAVIDMAIAPNGSWLVTTSADHTSRIWNVTTGTTRRILRGHTGPVSGVAIAADGRSLATSSADGTLRLWSPNSQHSTGVLEGHVGEVTGVAMARDGRWLASSGDDQTIRTWSFPGAGGRFDAALRVDAQLHSVGIGADGLMVAAGAGGVYILRLVPGSVD